jgi:hypothetical protein
MAAAEACLYGRPLGFPVDVSTRRSDTLARSLDFLSRSGRRMPSSSRTRRSGSSESQAEKDAFFLKDAPIRFLRKLGVDSRGGNGGDREP